MAIWEDAQRLALALPEASERLSREEVIVEAWLARAPARSVEAFLAERGEA
jgi:hypothetical protein